MKPFLLALISLFAAVGLNAQSAEAVYESKSLGDKVFSIDLGIDAPLFFQDLDGKMVSTNLGVGGILGLSMEGYLNNNYRLGGGFKLNFSSNPNGKFLFNLPFFFRNTYEYRFYPFSLRASMDAGVVLVSYNDQIKVDPFLSPSLGLSYNVNAQWTAGLNLGYWWIPQLYLGNDKLWPQSRFGNFSEITLGFTYHWY